MTMLTPPMGPTKVTARHLKRDAYLYVRQSTLRQVVENTESTQRQYGGFCISRVAERCCHRSALSELGVPVVRAPSSSLSVAVP